MVEPFRPATRFSTRKTSQENAVLGLVLVIDDDVATSHADIDRVLAVVVGNSGTIPADSYSLAPTGRHANFDVHIFRLATFADRLGCAAGALGNAASMLGNAAGALGNAASMLGNAAGGRLCTTAMVMMPASVATAATVAASARAGILHFHNLGNRTGVHFAQVDVSHILVKIASVGLGRGHGGCHRLLCTFRRWCRRRDLLVDEE